MTTIRRSRFAVGDAHQPARVLERRLGIVDRARPDDHQQALAIAAVQDVADRAARLEHELGGAAR